MVDQTVTIKAILLDRVSTSLSKIGAGFREMRSRINDIGTASSPVFTKLAGLVAGVVSVSAALKSIQSAEAAVRAEQKLLTALQGRTEALEEIKKTAEDIQRLTEQEGDALLEQAALMVRLGISAAAIPKALRAAVDAAAALNRPVEDIVRELAIIEQGGEARGLGRLIPELKELTKEGASASVVIDLLSQKFSGAAEAIAKTDFGRVTQLSNAVEDQGERIGKVLVKIQVAFLELLLPILEKVATAVESTGFQTLLEIFNRLLPYLVGAAVAIGGIGAALSTLALVPFLTTVITSLAAILTELFAIAAAVAPILLPLLGIGAAIAAAIAGAVLLGNAIAGWLNDGYDFFDVIGEVVDGLGKAKDEALAIVQQVREGKLTLADVFDILSTKVRQAAILYQTFIYQPLINIFRGVVNTITAGVDVITAGAKKGVILVASSVQGSLLAAVRVVATAVDGVLNGINFALKKIDEQLGSSLSFGGASNLAGEVPEEIFDLDSLSEALNKELADATRRFTTGLSSAVQTTVFGIGQGLAKIYQEQIDLENRIAAAIESNLAKRRDAILREAELEQQKNDKILASSRALSGELARVLDFQRLAVSVSDLLNLNPDEIRKAIDSIDDGSREALKGIITKELENQLRTERITLEEFLKLRREIEVGLTDDLLKKQEAIAAAQDLATAALKEELDVVKGLIVAEETRLQAMMATGVSAADQIPVAEKILELRRQETELSGQLQDATNATLDIERKRQELLIKLAATEQQIRALRVQFADQALNELKTQASELEKIGDGVANLVEKGTISGAEGTRRLQRAVEEFEAETIQAREEIRRLLEESPSNPALLEDLSRLEEELNKLGGVKVKVQLDLTEAISAEARSEFEKATQDVQDRFESGKIDLTEAIDELGVAVVELDSKALEAQSKLAELLSQQTLSQEAMDKVVELRAEIEKLNELRLSPQIDLVESIGASVSEAKSTLETELAEISQQASEGFILQSEAIQKQEEALAKFNDTVGNSRSALETLASQYPELRDEIQQTIDKVDELDKKVNRPPQTDLEQIQGGFEAGFSRTASNLANLRELGLNVGEDLANSLGDALVDVFIKGEKSFGEFLRSFLAGIAIMIARAFLFKAITTAFGIPTVGANKGGLILGGLGGGDAWVKQHPGVKRFAHGGSVPGPMVNRDMVPALLTPGEHVMDVPSVKYYGVEIMSALLKRAIPRSAMMGLLPGRGSTSTIKSAFAEGGEVVQALGRSGSSGGQRVYNFPDEQSANRGLAGGGPSMFTFLRENRDQARAALGL